jgi:hypothetical protein
MSLSHSIITYRYSAIQSPARLSFPPRIGLICAQAPEQNDWQEFKPLFGGGKIKICDTLRAVTPFGSKEQKSVWLERGAIIRRQHGGTWLVLHHIPPIVYPWSTKEEAEAAELVDRNIS